MNPTHAPISPVILGVDPAPTKEAVAYDGAEFHRKPPHELRLWLEEQQEKAGHRGMLIAWDAPLTVDRAYRCPNGKHQVGYYRREIDDLVKKWVRNWTDKRLEFKAVGVGHLAAVPHWVLTCDVLGLPFGTPFATLARGPLDVSAGGVYAIEVHPAVSLAVWWIELGCWGRMPGYKGNGNKGLTTIVRRLNSSGVFDLPSECSESDDHLDAWIAWRMAHDFVFGGASWVGDPDRGGYVLPNAATKVGLRWEAGVSF